jgi:hypothetical protein
MDYRLGKRRRGHWSWRLGRSIVLEIGFRSQTLGRLGFLHILNNPENARRPKALLGTGFLRPS